MTRWEKHRRSSLTRGVSLGLAAPTDLDLQSLWRSGRRLKLFAALHVDLRRVGTRPRFSAPL